MMPEQQRIAIAEACGEISPRFTKYGTCIASSAVTYCGKEWGTHGVPDYLNDLNAMHEAVRALSKPDIATYEVFLAELVKADGVFLRRCFTGEIAKISEATAAQRAEAFLRTIGKWVES